MNEGTNHHHTFTALGTSGHNHHRAVIEAGGLRQSYWRCDLGTAPLHACPKEPDPMERLLVKVAEGRQQEPAPEDPVCIIHPVERQKTYNGKRMCLVCQQERDRRKRARRAADRITRDALKVA